jgi:hypothetical protein
LSNVRDPVGSPLARLQRVVTDAVLGVSRSDNALQGPTDVGGFLVAGKRGLTPADRLEIYREQFWLRHQSNLVDDFPTLRWVVGGDLFRELASGYLTVHPPRTWNLQRLGADLAAYVANHPRWSADPLALDASRLDWAFMESFDAPDAGPLDLAPLVNAPEEAVTGARLTFHPSLRRLALGHPAHELREAVQRGEAKERPSANDVRVVVWRDPTFVLRATAVEPLAFELLAALSAGVPLGEACESVANAHGTANDLGERVNGWFRQWTASGWVSALELAR